MTDNPDEIPVYSTLNIKGDVKTKKVIASSDISGQNISGSSVTSSGKVTAGTQASAAGDVPILENVGTELEPNVKIPATLVEDIWIDDSQIVTSWTSPTTDDNIPSETLVKTSLDAKLDDTQIATQWGTEQNPTQYVTDGYIPSTSLTKSNLDAKLNNSQKISVWGTDLDPEIYATDNNIPSAELTKTSLNNKLDVGLRVSSWQNNPDNNHIPSEALVKTSLDGKVDKVNGYSLMSNAEHTKLEGIETGAEVNVQANWNEDDTSSDAFIQNKPAINNATLTIQRNSTSVGTFTANASEDSTVNITVPTQPSDIGAQEALVDSGTDQNIKTINNTTLLGAGDIQLQVPLVGSGTGQNIKTINNSSILGTGDIQLQVPLVGSGTGQNVKTINNNSIVGTGNISVQPVITAGVDYVAHSNTASILYGTNDQNTDSTKAITLQGSSSDSQFTSSSTDVQIPTSKAVYTALTKKQDTLVSSGTGQNIKTINNTTLLGTGNISLQTPLTAGTDYVAHSTDSSVIYATNGSSVDTPISYSTGSDGSYIVQRQSNGQITVPQTPVADTDAASKAFVNSSIGTSTANFIGTFPALYDADNPYSLGFTQAQVDTMKDPQSSASSVLATTLATKLTSLGITPSNNDYAFIEMDFTDPATSPDEYRRYKYIAGSPGTWVYEYTLNNSSFTQAQWDAINSGVSATKVGQYDTHLSDTNNPHSVTKAQVGLGSVVNAVMDNSPTYDSTNYVSSGGVYTALGDKVDKLTTSPAGTYTKVTVNVQGQVTTGSSPTTLSGYGITDAVSANTVITGATKTKITYDAKGLVTSGVDLEASDIPSLDWSKITSGKPTTLSGYGITDASINTSTNTITLGSNTITPLTQHQDISGKVNGPSSSTANDIAIFDGTTGKVIKDSGYTIATSVPSGAVFTDTKNTAGATDSSSKLFIIGATSQGDNPQTYSQDTAYVGTDGCLYSGGIKVLTSETPLSKGTTTGDGNAVTDISVSGHTITLTKGTTFLTSHQDISGKVDGPASSTANDVAIFDGTTGKVIKDSGKTLGASIPAPTANQDEGKAIVVNASGTGFIFGEAGKVDDVKINGTSVLANKVANIPKAGTSTLGVVQTGYTTSGKDYAVVADSSGNLHVEVPWTATAQEQADWTETNSAEPSYIKNKPTLATVATSGSYNDLSNKPTIPAAQIQSDWDQTNTSALDYIKNKPTVPTTYVSTVNGQSGAVTVASIDLTNVNVGSANAGKYLKIDSAGGAIYDTAAQYTLITATIAVNAWSSNTATVTASGVTANNLILVASATSNMATYSACGVKATEQSTNTLTFTCATIPNVALDVIIMIMEN